MSKKYHVGKKQAQHIAFTIFGQLGGEEFIEKTGCSNLQVLTDDFGGLRLKLNKNKSQANSLSIVLQFTDLYKVSWEKVDKDGNISVLDTEDEVYAFDLPEVFRNYTGMDNPDVPFEGLHVYGLDENLKPIDETIIPVKPRKGE